MDAKEGIRNEKSRRRGWTWKERNEISEDKGGKIISSWIGKQTNIRRKGKTAKRGRKIRVGEYKKKREKKDKRDKRECL